MLKIGPLNLIILIKSVLVLSNAFAQSAGPQPLPMPTQIAAPQDTPYTGTISLNVDATDVERHIFRVRETIPVRPAESLVLLYPEGLPGNHSPSGRIDKLAGLTIRANGKRLEWTRDPVNVFAFRVEVPTGVAAIETEFQFDSPVDTNEGRVVMT